MHHDNIIMGAWRPSADCYTVCDKILTRLHKLDVRSISLEHHEIHQILYHKGRFTHDFIVKRGLKSHPRLKAVILALHSRKKYILQLEIHDFMKAFCLWYTLEKASRKFVACLWTRDCKLKTAGVHCVYSLSQMFSTTHHRYTLHIFKNIPQ